MGSFANPFLRLSGSLPPLIPKPDPVPLTTESQDSPMLEEQPLQAFPSRAQKPAKFDPQSASPQEVAMRPALAKLRSDEQKDIDPWGSPDNHPGFMGKLGHALSVATGGPNRRQFEESGLEKSLQEMLNSQTGNEEKQANTEHLNAETPEIAPNAESLRKYQGAETQHAQAETTVLENPPDATPEIGTYRSLVKMGMSPSQALQEIEKDKAMALRPQQIAPEQQYLTEYAQKHPGSTVAQAEHQYMLDTQRPVQAPAVNMFVPAAGGGETLQTVRPGQTVAPGAQTAAGVNAVNTPTMTQRTAAGRAQVVVEMAPDLLKEIDDLGPELGPIMGNWNAFMQGKIGMDNPKFAGLRADFLMMSSAVALAHAQGRLPENLREEFDHAINAPNQTPDNLKATIQHMIPWMQKMQEQGHPNAQPSGGESGGPPAGAKVRDYTQLGH